MRRKSRGADNLVQLSANAILYVSILPIVLFLNLSLLPGSNILLSDMLLDMKLVITICSGLSNLFLLFSI